MSLRSLVDTICARSTPPGKSALALVRLTGTDAIAITGKIIRDPDRLFVAPGGTTIYTDIIADSGAPLDDVVVTVFRAPKSYTGEDVVEITSHGADIIVDALLERLYAHGARAAEPGEFSRRAWMNGKMDLAEVEGLAFRVEAQSEQMLYNAAGLIQRKFEKLRALYDSIIVVLALLNAEIDFGESDQIDASAYAGQLAHVRALLGDLLQATENKLAGSGYLSVALVGPPNVGKSSIFNALLRFERSIVSHIPGTTRDYVEAHMILKGKKIKIIDTAGVRAASEEVESRGIELGVGAQREADVIFRVTDPSTRDAEAHPNEVLVHNKCDVDHYSSGICISAKDDDVTPLVAYLEQISATHDIGLSSAVVSSGEAERLQTVLSKLDAISSVDDPSIVAEQLKQASDIIGELLGLNAGEASLNYIFSKMCIGK